MRALLSQFRRLSASYALSANRRLLGRATSNNGIAILMSAMFPGVKLNATGLPQSSAKQWILLVLPPRDVPIACVQAPLLSLVPNDVL